MTQLVFRDNEKVLTTTNEGKILFPHKDIKAVQFDGITIIDNFEIAYEKENFGFFIGNKVDLVLPGYKLMAPFFSTINELLSVPDAVLYKTDNFYIIETRIHNTIIGKDGATGRLIINREDKEIRNAAGYIKLNSKYYAIHNATSKSRYMLNIDSFKAYILYTTIERNLSKEDLAVIGFASLQMARFERKGSKILYTDAGIFVEPEYIANRYSAIFKSCGQVVTCSNLELEPHRLNIIGKEVYQKAIDESVRFGYIMEGYDVKDSYFEDKTHWEGYDAAYAYRHLLTTIPDHNIKAEVVFINIDKFNHKLEDGVYEAITSFVARSMREADEYLKVIGKSGVKNIDVIKQYNYKSCFKLA